MSVTLSTARAKVSSMAQDFLASTATGGSTTTVVDTNNLYYADGYWDETTVLFTNGTNNEVQRRVQTYTASTSTLTLYSAAPGSASGGTYELYRRFSPTDVLNGLNRAINIGSPDFREKARAIATATADTLQYALPTGPDFTNIGIVAVEYQAYNLASQATWPYQKLSPQQYSILEDFNGTSTVRTLQLNFNPETNKLIRLIYEGPLGTVATGTDVIRLDQPELEWLYTQATTELWRTEVSRTSDASRKSALEELARWETDADKLRRQLAMEQPRRPIRRSTFRVFV